MEGNPTIGVASQSHCVMRRSASSGSWNVLWEPSFAMTHKVAGYASMMSFLYNIVHIFENAVRLCDTSAE